MSNVLKDHKFLAINLATDAAVMLDLVETLLTRGWENSPVFACSIFAAALACASCISMKV